jgi:colanic acid biosynthesis glycosyl transferase WcaI
VVVLDRFMAQRIEAKQVPPEKIVTLPPWSRDHLVSYDSGGRKRFRCEHGLDGKFVVMYSGNHSPCHPLQTLLEAANALRNRPDIAFCFVGGGTEFKTVQEFAKTHALENIKTIPYQPVACLSASLASADLHVVVMGNPFVGLVHPCKVYNIRALGIPYLYIGPVESHVSELEPTFSARHGDVRSVVTSIQHASREVIRRVDYRNNALHSQSNVVRRMTALLEEAGLAQSPTPSAVAINSDTP